VLQQVLEGAEPGARVVVVGVCMEPDTIEPIYAINKEMDLRFAFGYSPQEFAATLGHIAEGTIPVEPLVTGIVGLEGVAGAFEELAHPDRHAKILIDPWRTDDPETIRPPSSRSA
jgi:threonine dehydrogenase-like Zn-dependent dehydrogenase